MHGVYVRLLLRPHFRRIDVDTFVYVNCAFRILLILIFFVFFFPSPTLYTKAIVLYHKALRFGDQDGVLGG